MAIKIGEYLWSACKPIPDCDSCGGKIPQYKVYVPDKIGLGYARTVYWN